MKSKILLAVVVAALSTAAHAVPIVGNVGFTGTYTSDSPGNLAAATAMTITAASVNYADGDLTGAGAPLTFLTPITVNAAPNSLAGLTLWTVTVGAETYTFDVLTSGQSFTSATQIALLGTGIMDSTAAGKDPTAGTWQLTFGKTGTAFTWQSTSGANLPDGGTTLAMLGAALVAVVGFSRKSLA